MQLCIVAHERWNGITELLNLNEIYGEYKVEYSMQTIRNADGILMCKLALLSHMLRDG